MNMRDTESATNGLGSALRHAGTGKPLETGPTATRVFLSLSTMALVLSGCADVVNETQLETSRQPLATAFQTGDPGYSNPWPSPGSINVCFMAPGGGVPNVPLVARAVIAIQNSWEAATGVTFAMNGTCPTAVPNNWISIFLDDAPPFFAAPVAAGGGIGKRFNSTNPAWATLGPQIDNRSDVQIYLNSTNDPWEVVVAHEVGHALGFYHEFERRDNNGGCQQNPQGNVLGWLTAFDATSIMMTSGCPVPVERTATSLLSLLDQLGAEMIYPRTFSQHSIACEIACFVTNTGVVVRGNGVMSIDWVVRGATISPVWRVGATTFQGANGRLPATVLASGSSNVTMTFNDPLQRAHSGSGIVQKDDSLHAAIAMAIVQPLIL